MNYEELVKELAKALCRIGDALPQAQLHLLLHPTTAMKGLVVGLYVLIIKFTRRAMKWFNESRLQHMISSITHPYGLRFKDMVDTISETSRRVERLALSLSMTELRQTRLELENTRREQRAIHDIAVRTDHKIDGWLRCLWHIQVALTWDPAYHSIQHSGLIDTNRRVCEIQFSLLMSFTSASPFSTPEFSRNYYTVRRNCNRRRGLDNNKVVQDSLQLRAWSSGKESSQLGICGSFNTRQTVRDFAADMIDLITEAQVPVLWALNIPHSELQYSPEDIIKYIISQVLRKNHTLLNERSAALNAARYQSATTVDDWVALLGKVLEGLPHAYLIIDVDFLQNSEGTVTSWTQLFQRLFEGLEARGARTILKVALLGSRTAHRSCLNELDQRQVLQLPKARISKVTKASARTSSYGRARKARGLLYTNLLDKAVL